MLHFSLDQFLLHRLQRRACRLDECNHAVCTASGDQLVPHIVQHSVLMPDKLASLTCAMSPAPATS